VASALNGRKAVEGDTEKLRLRLDAEVFQALLALAPRAEFGERYELYKGDSWL